MKKWYEKKFFKNLIVLVLVLLAIFISYSILPLFGNIFGFILKVITPFLFSAILFYILKPLVVIINRYLPLIPSIIVVYLISATVVAFLITFIYPIVVKQIEMLGSISLEPSHNTGDFISVFIDKIKEEIVNIMENINTLIVTNTASIISTLTEFVTALFLMPFITFYFLKDSKKIYDNIVEKVPKKYELFTRDLLTDIDIALSHFISGRIITSMITSSLLFISFLIIGLDYALILTLIAFIFYIIPTVGAFIAIIPPILVGFSMSPLMGVTTLIITVIVSTLEGFWISTHVMGRALFIHPITMILILIIGGSLKGIVGLLFITPAYSLLKIIIKHVYKATRKYKVFRKKKLEQIIET